MTPKQEFNLELFSRTLGFKLRRTQVRLYTFFGPIFERHQFTPTQYAVLSTLSENPGCSQIQVARALAIDPPALVGLLDKLTKRKLIEKRQSKIDRRSSELFLTTEGDKCYTVLTQEVNQLDQSIRDQFTPLELEQFSSFIERMNQFFDEQKI